MNLRQAFSNIHNDPFWWRKILINGAWMLTGIGAPMAAGFVVESLDFIRKGYPTPLPPSTDPSTRYIIGLFALIIDFFFFVLPLMIGGLLVLCVLAVAGLSQFATWFALLALLFLVLVFLASVAPVGRLVYAEHGEIERALSVVTVREALNSERRGAYLRARLLSLVGYIPFVLCSVAFWWAANAGLPFVGAILLVLGWLAASALVYAHLVVVQLYGMAVRIPW